MQRELFCSDGSPGIDQHSELFHPADSLALTSIGLAGSWAQGKERTPCFPQLAECGPALHVGGIVWGMDKDPPEKTCGPQAQGCNFSVHAWRRSWTPSIPRGRLCNCPVGSGMWHLSQSIWLAMSCWWPWSFPRVWVQPWGHVGQPVWAVEVLWWPAVGCSLGVLPEPSDLPAMSSQGSLAGRAKSPLCL
nr:uncharacterized protein LOC103246023 isoform X2 [Chlorocebus sabaeus]